MSWVIPDSKGRNLYIVYGVNTYHKEDCDSYTDDGCDCYRKYNISQKIKNTYNIKNYLGNAVQSHESLIIGVELKLIKHLEDIKITDYYSRKDLETRLKEEDSKFSASIVTTNNWEDVRISMRYLKKYGRSGILGFPGRDNSLPTYNPFDPYYFYANQLTFKAVGLLTPEREKINLKYIDSLFAQKKISSKSIVSSIIDAENYQNAYDRLSTKKNNEVTFILDWK